MAEQAGPIRQAASQWEGTGRQPFWSLPYVLVCAAQFLSYGNGVMLDPVLPLYLTGVGQTPAFVGITIVAFSISSFATRPFLGQGVDRWSARGIYLLGALALAASSFTYLVPSLAALLVARVVQGLGWAAINTAGIVIAVDSTPASRRGEALGYFSMMPGLAMALTPPVGLGLFAARGFSWVCVLSGLLGFAAVAAAALVYEAPRVRRAEPGLGFWASLLEPRVLLPSVLLFLLVAAQPITNIYIALYARARGIDGLTLFFLASGASMVGARALGHFSDRWGRAPMIGVGFALAALGLALMLAADTLLPLVLGGAIFSGGASLANPAIMALAVDLAPRHRRGAALATFTAAFQIAWGSAGFLWGLIIEWSGYEGMFLGAIALAVAGLAVLGANWQSAGGGRTRGTAE
ncbi:MAG: MFS transporter [Chloroflexi bacterium]|nr:MFS transporter [Chloroflexota bacterium]